MSSPAISPRDQERERIRDLLGNNPLFGHLSAAERWALSEHIEVRTLAKGEILFSAGDPATHLFVVVSGMLRPTDFVFTFTYGNNDVVGEAWLFAEGEEVHLRHSGVRCDHENTEILAVPYGALEPHRLNGPFLLALLQRQQRYTNWALKERTMAAVPRS